MKIPCRIKTIIPVIAIAVITGCQSFVSKEELDQYEATNPLQTKFENKGPSRNPVKNLPKEKLYGKWSCNYESWLGIWHISKVDSSISPKKSFNKFYNKYELTYEFHPDGTYSTKMSTNGKPPEKGDGMWMYNQTNGALTLYNRKAPDRCIVWYDEDTFNLYFHSAQVGANWFSDLYKKEVYTHPNVKTSTYFKYDENMRSVVTSYHIGSYDSAHRKYVEDHKLLDE